MLSGGDIASLAILTPYNGQVRELQLQQKQLMAAAGPDVSIDISSVDAYQVGMVVGAGKDIEGSLHGQSLQLTAHAGICIWNLKYSWERQLITGVHSTKSHVHSAC